MIGWLLRQAKAQNDEIGRWFSNMRPKRTYYVPDYAAVIRRGRAAHNRAKRSVA